MKQGIVGGLLVIGGVILSPFGPWVLGWMRTLSLIALSATLSVSNYAWTLWAHGGSDTFLWHFLVVLWTILLVDAAFLLVYAVFLAVDAARVFALDQTRNTRVNFSETVSDLCNSCLAFSFCIIFLYIASWVDAGVGSWTTEPSLFAESTYNSLFYWGVKVYLSVYPVSMVVAGLYILQNSCRKWGQSMSRG